MPSRPPTFRPAGITPQQTRQQYDRLRGSATTRGYDAKWRRYRLRFLSLPENLFCACGCGEPATVVDHIIPVAGPTDLLFWTEDNHQALSKRCHDRKTASGNAWMGTAAEFAARRARRGTPSPGLIFEGWADP